MANYKLPTKGQVTARTNSNREKYASTLSKEENDIRLKQNASFIGSSNDPFSTPGRDNYQTYPYDYYAGSDCKIFFGDIWVDDIITIQYNSTQSKTPIYGYASQNFDAIARGQILVEGNLAIAFKETGYLNIIQATLESQRVDASQLIQGKIKKIQDNDQQKFVPGLTTINDDSKEKLDFSYSANGTPQIIRQAQTIEQILTSKKSTEVLNTKFGGTSASDFEDFAEILEDSIWGDSNGKTLELENKLKRVDEFDYTGTGGILTAKGHNYSDVLNIMLTFGDINDTRAEHTMIVLNDIHFTSTSMIVAPNGDPIGEMYTFIARDINKSINTTANIYNINPIKLSIGNGAKLSKLEDINSIEQFLNNKDQTNDFNITLNAGLIDNEWYPADIPLGKQVVTFNKVTPFTDQLCSTVENFINVITQETIPTNYTQAIVTVDFNNSIGFDVNSKITMILEQIVPGTKSYKVISPTRTGFSLNNIITRDDIFEASMMQAPTSAELTASEQLANRVAQEDLLPSQVLGTVSVDVKEVNANAQVAQSSVDEQNQMNNTIRGNDTAVYTDPFAETTQLAVQEAQQRTASTFEAKADTYGTPKEITPPPGGYKPTTLTIGGRTTPKNEVKPSTATLAEQESHLSTSNLKKYNPTEFLGDTTVALSPELKKLYKDKPPTYTHVDYYKSLERTQGVSTSVVAGFLAEPKYPGQDTAYISINAELANSKGLNTFLHEEEHGGQFKKSKNIEKTKEKLFPPNTPYEFQPGEQQARKVASDLETTAAAQEYWGLATKYSVPSTIANK